MLRRRADGSENEPARLMGLLCNSCLYGRIFYFNSPTLSVPTDFDNRLVQASTPVPFAKSANEAMFRLINSERAKYGLFDGLLSASQTRAFVVSRDSQIRSSRLLKPSGPERTRQTPSPLAPKPAT